MGTRLSARITTCKVYAAVCNNSFGHKQFAKHLQVLFTCHNSLRRVCKCCKRHNWKPLVNFANFRQTGSLQILQTSTFRTVLPAKTASGPDGISSKMLKNTAPAIASSLSSIYSTCPFLLAKFRQNGSSPILFLFLKEVTQS